MLIKILFKIDEYLFNIKLSKIYLTNLTQNICILLFDTAQIYQISTKLTLKIMRQHYVITSHNI